MRSGVVVGGVIFGVAASLACSSFDAEPPSEVPDAAAPNPTEAGANDSGKTKENDAAETPPPRCSLERPFGAPSPLSQIGPFTDFGGVRLSHDELRIYFWSRQRPEEDPTTLASESDLFFAERTEVGGTFGNVKAMTALNSGVDEAAPTLTADELTIYFSRNGTSHRVLYVATRATRTDFFGEPQALPLPAQANNPPRDPDDGTPWVVPGGAALYFSSYGRPTTSANDYDIFRVVLPSPEANPSPLLTLNELRSPKVDSSAVFTDDELTVYFKSERENPKADLYIARRTNVAEAFGTPTKVQELSTTDGDVPNWVSGDGCILYYVSNTKVFFAQRGK